MRRWRRATSAERIALRRTDGSDMAERPDQDAGEPELEAEADGPGERAVEDRHGARRTAEQDGLAESAVDRGTKRADSTSFGRSSSAAQ